MALIVADNIHKDYRIGEITISALKGLSFEIGTACFYNVPYKNPNNPEAEKKFKQIQWAYERLRKHNQLQAVPPGDSLQGHPFMDSADPFLNFFVDVRSHYSKKKEGK